MSEVYVVRLPESAYRYYQKRYSVYREMNVPEEEQMRLRGTGGRRCLI